MIQEGLCPSKWWLISAVFILAMGCQGERKASQPRPPPAKALLIVSPSEIDLGKVEQGAQKRLALNLRNPGTKPVRVGRIQTSCSCLRLELLDPDIPAEDYVPAELQLDMRKEPDFVGGLRIDVAVWESAGELAFRLTVDVDVIKGQPRP